MPSTAGNDTVNAGALIHDLDGMSGNDLLILDYRAMADYQGHPITGLSVDTASSRLSTLLFLGGTTQDNTVSERNFYISNFEHIDFYGSENFNFSITTGSGNDTLRGGILDDIFNAGSGRNLIYGGTGNDSIEVKAGQATDHLYGGDGNDVFYGLGFNDKAYGGAGTDTASVDLRGSGAAFDGDLASISKNENWSQIEYIIAVRLTQQDDTFRLTYYSGYTDNSTKPDLQLSGGGGNDLLIIDRTGLSASYVEFEFAGYDFWGDSGQNSFQPNGFERLKFTGSGGNDTVEASRGNDSIWGGGGDDKFGLSTGADFVDAGAGNDQIFGVSANDTILGGSGFDSADINLTDFGSSVHVGEGRSFANISSVEWVSGTLTKFGDYANLGAADHRLDGGLGVDTLVLNYSTSSAAYIDYQFDPESKSGIIQFINPRTGLPTAPIVELREWEIYSITGSSQVDNFITQNGSDTLKGGGGDDIFDADLGHNMLYGGAGNDTFYGNIGAQDMVFGGDGNDIFSSYVDWYSFDANDKLYGGAGFDVASANYSSQKRGVTFDLHGIAGEWSGINAAGEVTLSGYSDTATLGAGTGFSLDGGAGSDLLVLNYSSAASRVVFKLYSENEGDRENYDFEILLKTGKLTGINVVNFERLNLTATNGNDHFVGFSGTDHLLGLSGNDTLSGDLGNDFVYGGIGDDSLSGSLGNDFLQGDAGRDALMGDSGSDALRGDTGRDQLWGGTGSDLLYGGSDSDYLIGEAGNDTMAGGTGADYFVFEGNIESGRDKVVDFDGATDRLYISGGVKTHQQIVSISGADLLVTWAHGSVRLIGAADDQLVILHDSDFL